MAQADALAVQAQADLVLYQSGFTDGVASVASPVGDVTAAQEALDIQAAVDPLNAQIAALQQQLSDLSTAKAADDTVIQGLQASVTQIQELAQELASIVIPQPVQTLK